MQVQSKNINKVGVLLYSLLKYSFKNISNLVLYPRSAFGGKIMFVPGLI